MTPTLPVQLQFRQMIHLTSHPIDTKTRLDTKSLLSSNKIGETPPLKATICLITSCEKIKSEDVPYLIFVRQVEIYQSNAFESHPSNSSFINAMGCFTQIVMYINAIWNDSETSQQLSKTSTIRVKRMPPRLQPTFFFLPISYRIVLAWKDPKVFSFRITAAVDEYDYSQSVFLYLCFSSLLIFGWV